MPVTLTDDEYEELLSENKRLREALQKAPPFSTHETVRAGRIVEDPLPPDFVAYANWYKSTRQKALSGEGR